MSGEEAMILSYIQAAKNEGGCYRPLQDLFVTDAL